MPLAKKFAGVNWDLKALIVLGSPVIWMEDASGQVSGHEVIDLLGLLVMKQWKLVEECDSLIYQI